MATAKETMSVIEANLVDIRAQIEKLRIEEAVLLRVLRSVKGETEEVARKRIPNVKQHVLDIMHTVGGNGATSSEVFNLARVRHPEISRDTISSVLSRLKSAEALIYDGERYFEAGQKRSRAGDIIAATTRVLDLAH